MTKPSAIVMGVGALEGLGSALCHRFAKEGYHVFVAGRTLQKINDVVFAIRSSGGSAESIPTDTTNEADIAKLFGIAFEESEKWLPPDLVVFNAGNNRRIALRELSAEEFEEFWRVGCFGGFLVGREAARYLAPLGRGSIFFTGASASLRGRPGFAHFSAAKAGLRMLSQSMAREFGPQGLHVAHVVIDGGIFGERLKSHMSQESREATNSDAFLNIDAIAQSYWHLHLQDKSAWTQELDLRPFKESF